MMTLIRSDPKGKLFKIRKVYTRNFNVKVSAGEGKAVIGAENMYGKNWPVCSSYYMELDVWRGTVMATDELVKMAASKL